MPSLDFYQYLIWNISVFFFQDFLSFTKSQWKSGKQVASQEAISRRRTNNCNDNGRLNLSVAWRTKLFSKAAAIFIYTIYCKIGFSSTWNQSKNGFLSGKLIKIILHFLRIFLAYLMFFQSFAVPSACSILQNHQICFLAFNLYGVSGT